MKGGWWWSLLSGVNSVERFLGDLVGEQCRSYSGNLLQDELASLKTDPFDNPTSIRYPQLQGQLKKLLPRHAKSSISDEAMSQFTECQAEDALYRIYQTQRFVSNTDQEECQDSALHIYYIDPLEDARKIVSSLDYHTALNNAALSDCAIKTLESFAERDVLKMARVYAPAKKGMSVERVIDLASFGDKPWMRAKKELDESSFDALLVQKQPSGRLPKVLLY